MFVLNPYIATVSTEQKRFGKSKTQGPGTAFYRSETIETP